MSSSTSRSYYYTSNEVSSSRSKNSRENLPPLRSVLGAQLDLPIQSGSGLGSYDLREMSKALPRQSHTSTSSEYRMSTRSGSGHGAYGDRDRDRECERRDPKAYTFPPSTTPAVTSTHKSGHPGHSHTSSVSNGYQARQITPTYGDRGYGYGSSYSDPSMMDRGHGNKKYACTWPGCEKRFERQNALDTHMNIHTDQKPYACPVANCGKVFNVRSNMRRHLLTHKDYHTEEDEDRPMSSRSSKGYYGY